MLFIHFYLYCSIIEKLLKEDPYRYKEKILPYYFNVKKKDGTN